MDISSGNESNDTGRHEEPYNSLPMPPDLPPDATVDECFTKIISYHLKQVWKLEHFSTLAKLSMSDTCLRSIIFADPAFPDAQWQLVAYPNAKCNGDQTGITLFLLMISQRPDKQVSVNGRYRFDVLNEKGDAIFSHMNVAGFTAPPLDDKPPWSWMTLPIPLALSFARENDTLTFRCHLEFMENLDEVTCSHRKEVPTVPHQPVCAAFVERQAQSMNEQLMADCHLECDGQIIPANRFVLSNHSQVFLEMFSQEGIPKKCLQVVIENTEAAAIRLMVEYAYCGYVDLGPDAVKVLDLAKRYKMDELAQLCESKLCSQVAKNNVAEMLLLANQFDCPFLQNAVVEMVLLQKSYVFATNGWKSLRESHPELVNEVMERIILDTDFPTNYAHSSQQL